MRIAVARAPFFAYRSCTAPQRLGLTFQWTGRWSLDGEGPQPDATGVDGGYTGPEMR